MAAIYAPPESGNQMSYDVKTDESGRKTVSFHMDAEGVDRLFREVRREIQKDIVVPGFRKGKIPSSILKQKFGNLILSEVAEKAHREMSDILFEENDWILSDAEPEFKPVLPAEGRDYDYEVTYTLFETPAPTGYRGISIAVPAFDEEKALEEALAEIRDRFVSFEHVDRAAEQGDLVVVEYPSRENGEPRKAAVVIGRENMGPGFDGLLPGLSAGDGFSARMDFPGLEEEPPATRFSVSEVREPKNPELDDDFAKAAGGFESMEKLREKLRENIREKHQSERRSFIESVAIDSLLESNVFDPPSFMADNLARDYAKRLEDGELTPETERTIRELAERKVREFLILRQIAIIEGIPVTPDEVEKEASGGSASSALDRLRNERALELVLSNAVETVAEPRAEQPDKNGEPETSWKWVAVDDKPGREDK